MDDLLRPSKDDPAELGLDLGSSESVSGSDRAPPRDDSAVAGREPGKRWRARYAGNCIVGAGLTLECPCRVNLCRQLYFGRQSPINDKEFFVGLYARTIVGGKRPRLILRNEVMP